jgi:hypothetical protein
VDLNGDGKSDFIVQGMGGTAGSSWWLVMSSAKGYTNKSLPNSQEPDIDTNSTKGVKNLIFDGNVWRWNGDQYELPKRKSKK